MKKSDYVPCAVCGNMYKDHSILRCEPATELELARIRRARETGKVKNPSWYRVPALPAIPGDADAKSTVQYVRAFEKLNGLKQA